MRNSTIRIVNYMQKQYQMNQDFINFSLHEVASKYSLIVNQNTQRLV
jgi:hypothetical protein